MDFLSSPNVCPVRTPDAVAEHTATRLKLGPGRPWQVDHQWDGEGQRCAKRPCDGNSVRVHSGGHLRATGPERWSSQREQANPNDDAVQSFVGKADEAEITWARQHAPARGVSCRTASGKLHVRCASCILHNAHCRQLTRVATGVALYEDQLLQHRPRPKALPIWQMLITDLGEPYPLRIAGVLRVSVRTVYRYNRTGQQRRRRSRDVAAATVVAPGGRGRDAGLVAAAAALAATAPPARMAR